MLSVLVVGGGLGGLCLAQGLQRHGVAVTVFERDASLTARPQGYRLHVDSRAGDALRQCLPPDLYELFLATTSRPSTRVTVLSEQLRPLTLREILLSGLRDVRFGATCTGYATLPGGRIRARFADGGTADGDVLVGADGIGSAVRRQYLPHAAIVDTGTRCVYGRTPLALVEKDLPAPLWDGFCPVTDRRGLGMALGLVQFRTLPSSLGLTASEDYVMWSLSARSGVLGPDASLLALAPDALHALVADTIRAWHPDLRRLVAEANPGTTFALPIRSSVPIEPWSPGPVTLLGDAIHAMAPSQGSGANLALFDAAKLCAGLTESGVAAIGGYEDVVRRVGFAAVRASLRTTGRDRGLRRVFHRFRR